MADAKTRSTSTLDEANAEGFLGTHVDVLPPDGYTLDGVVKGPKVTDDAYAEQRAAEHRPPDVSATSASEPAQDTSKASTSKASTSKSSADS